MSPGVVTMWSGENRLGLSAGATWTSFEQFRKEGGSSLTNVGKGVVGTLITKTGQYRVVEESDFQHLLGLASEVNRLRGGLRLVVSAAHSVQKFPDDTTVETLMAAVTMLGQSPVLPTRTGHEALDLGDSIASDEDEVELDPTKIRRPVGFSK